MKEEALLIFVRRPQLGKVKTRLAAAIGEEAALAVYKKLLAHTQTITSVLTCDKFVFYAEEIEDDDIWNKGYCKQMQANAGLGERMKAAFSLVFQKGYERVCIIGSDCFELTARLIRHAFDLLLEKELVIGPAADGGYYLLGMKNSLKDVFDGVAWSTDKVLLQTEEKIKEQNLLYALLPVLTDVDTVDDLPANFLTPAKN